jgi:hypothetical protein
MGAGQPRKYDSPEEMKKVVNNYFDKAIENNEHITITGLALALGFCDRQSIYDYEKLPEYSHIIKYAKMRVENTYEKNLFTPACTGSIFALKNMGWKDKSEQDLNHSGSISIAQQILEARKKDND